MKQMAQEEYERFIYLPIMGRIGNQLFQYAFAYRLAKDYGYNTCIIIDDYGVLAAGWVNSLKDYDLKNVKYISGRDDLTNHLFLWGRRAFKIYWKCIYTENAVMLRKRERLFQSILNLSGLIAIVRGYGKYRLNKRKNLYLYGYFQSERFFVDYREDIKKLYNQDKKLSEMNYPHLDKLKECNSVCISIKVEHNLGSSIYDVCDEAYYRAALDYIEEHVDNPLFFLCSDNVEKAKQLFFNDCRHEMICQPAGFPVSLTLAAMSKCKHFVINNTSFGWWAQYLSENEDKIVIAPSSWKKNDDPVDVYDLQDRWHLV